MRPDCNTFFQLKVTKCLDKVPRAKVAAAAAAAGWREPSTLFRTASESWADKIPFDERSAAGTM